MLMSQSNTSKLLLLISPRASATVPALFTLNPYCSMRGGSVRRILGSSSTNSSRLSSACWAETVGTAGFAILPRISFSRSSRTAFNSSIISRSFFGSCSLAARRASSRQSLCSLLGIMEYVRLKQLLHTLCSVQNKERQREAATTIVEQISAKQNGSVPTASVGDKALNTHRMAACHDLHSSLERVVWGKLPWRRPSPSTRRSATLVVPSCCFPLIAPTHSATSCSNPYAMPLHVFRCAEAIAFMPGRSMQRR